MDCYYKLRQLFYYKLRQVLQSAMDLSQIATDITKCDDYYKLRQYSSTTLPSQKKEKLTTGFSGGEQMTKSGNTTNRGWVCFF